MQPNPERKNPRLVPAFRTSTAANDKRLNRDRWAGEEKYSPNIYNMKIHSCNVYTVKYFTMLGPRFYLKLFQRSF